VSAWKTSLAVGVIFLAGLFTGTALVWKFTNQSETRAGDNAESAPFQPWQLTDRYVGYLAKKLELSSDQRIAISQIVTESQERTKVLFELVGPEMQMEMHEVRDAIRAVLEPEQQKGFDEIQKRRGRRGKDTPSRSEGEDHGKVSSPDDAAIEKPPVPKSKCQIGWPIDRLYWYPDMESCRRS
jgi:Spy/CpxP family protein refolding chaperone